MNIGIQSDDVKAQAERILSQGLNDYEALKNFLDNVVTNEVPGLWQGAGSDAYVTRYNELQPSFNAIKELINDIGTGLKANADYYEEADQAASQANAGR